MCNIYSFNKILQFFPLLIKYLFENEILPKTFLVGNYFYQIQPCKFLIINRQIIQTTQKSIKQSTKIRKKHITKKTLMQDN